MILLLSKGVARKGEIAVRLALGAGRTRLLRMLATEGAIVAIAAGAISVYLAYRVPTVLWAYLVKAGDYQAKKPDWAVFAYLAGLSLLAACIAGLAPARESLKIDLVSALKGLGGTHTRRSRSQSILVVAQIAVSFLLVVACVFLTRVQHRITSVSPGFETRHVFFIPLDIRAPAYSENSERSIYQTLEERLQQLPGVQSVSYASLVPFKQTGSGLEKLRLPGDAREQGRQGSVDIVSKDFFSTLGIPIVRGRGFEHADVTSQASTPVAIVSQSLAHSFWDGQDAIGKLIVMPDNRQVRIVGVARDTRSEVYGVLDGPRLYVLRDPRSFGGTLMVRFERDERSLSGSIETTVKTVDAEQIVVPQTLQSVVDEASDMFGRVTKLVVLLAGGASALALIGVFGIVSISVSRRTREFGMRTVLGASNRHIILSGLGSGARQVTLGVLFGFALAIPAMAVWERLAKGSPFQTNIFDPSVYIIATVLLFAVALGAIYVPVRRAANMDPVAALRYE
jgi:predicted permease